MRTKLAVAALVFAVVGCSGNSTGGQQSAQECTRQIRLDGVLFNGYGYTERPATRFSTADEADCDDVGPSPRGAVFSDDPPEVVVWSFAEYPPEEVLGVRFGEDSFAVFVAESVPRQEIDRIIRELSKPDG